MELTVKSRCRRSSMISLPWSREKSSSVFFLFFLRTTLQVPKSHPKERHVLHFLGYLLGQTSASPGSRNQNPSPPASSEENLAPHRRQGKLPPLSLRQPADRFQDFGFFSALLFPLSLVRTNPGTGRIYQREEHLFVANHVWWRNHRKASLHHRISIPCKWFVAGFSH